MYCILAVGSAKPQSHVPASPISRPESKAARIPANTPIELQILDASGMAIQTMRSVTYLQPGQEITLQRSVNVTSKIGEATWIGERCLEPLAVETIAAASDVLRVNVDHAR